MYLGLRVRSAHIVGNPISGRAGTAQSGDQEGGPESPELDR
jgi:hypothetical protein